MNLKTAKPEHNNIIYAKPKSMAIRQSGNQAIRQSGNQAIRQSGNQAIIHHFR
ncbi:MAG: hypothetical protein FWG89_05835 [Treponema sp.]|nr:hypothetical protein [Treponema sp.]